MKKNALMISVIATLLVAVFATMNRAHAANANVTLSVTAGTFTCSEYPIAVDLGSTGAATSAKTLSNDAWTSGFTCTDLLGTWSTNMVAQSSALTGASTGVIAASAITWTPAGSITQVGGNCANTTLGAGGTLNTSRTIIQKTSSQACDFTYAPDGMSVIVPAYSPVNAYTAVMTITNPS